MNGLTSGKTNVILAVEELVVTAITTGEVSIHTVWPSGEDDGLGVLTAVEVGILVETNCVWVNKVERIDN